MKTDFKNKFESFSGSLLKEILREPGGSSIILKFEKGQVSSSYWRLLQAESSYSWLDDGQKYGLPEVIDAVSLLGNAVKGEKIISAYVRNESGDLIFEFANKIKIEIFNFTGNEAWEVEFFDKTGQYSNYYKINS